MKSIIFQIMLAAGLLSACEMVHEFPEQGKEVDPTDIQTRINVKCQLQITDYSIITKALQGSESIADYDRRFIVNIYYNEYDESLVETHTITREASDLSDLLIETKLHTTAAAIADTPGRTVEKQSVP